MRYIMFFVFLGMFFSCRQYPIEPMDEFECELENFAGHWKYVATNNDTVLDSIPDITITIDGDSRILVDSLYKLSLHTTFSCQAGKDDHVFGGVVYELYSNDILLKHSRIFFALTLTHKYKRD